MAARVTVWTPASPTSAELRNEGAAGLLSCRENPAVWSPRSAAQDEQLAILADLDIADGPDVRHSDGTDQSRRPIPRRATIP